jgi:salicylate hydroxylase
MYKDVGEVLAKRREKPFTQQYIRGLPIGLKLSNGIVVGQQPSAQVKL